MSFLGNTGLGLRPVAEFDLPISGIDALGKLPAIFISGSTEGSTGRILLVNLIPANELVGLFQAHGSSKTTLLVQSGNPESDDKQSITRSLRAMGLPLAVRVQEELNFDMASLRKLAATAATSQAKPAPKPESPPSCGRMLSKLERHPQAGMVIDIAKVEPSSLHCGADVEILPTATSTAAMQDTYGTGHTRDQMVAGMGETHKSLQLM